jgi:4-amino-4-deoxy-L-arabinose transferase-like glycosyltransferase
MTILPVVIGLTFLGRNSSTHSDSILFLILGTLLAGPILIVFTNFYEILPYRYIPLIVFFAIGVGMFFSKKPIS